MTIKKLKSSPKGAVVIYGGKKKRAGLEVRLEEETVWLSQAQMARLFDKDVRTISEHIQHIFKERELSRHSVIRKFRITAADGKTYNVDHYNLDVIISVGYRVKSLRGTQFRIWATKILRDHIVNGYTVNQKRLRETGLDEFEQAVALVRRMVETKSLKGDEARGLLDVITGYAESWLLLQKYDEGVLTLPKTTPSRYVLDYTTANTAIQELKIDLLRKKQASELFGAERDQMLPGILGSINQTFGGQELYPSIEAKAAHLLYFIIKDHAFSDGNKRIGSFLFIVFLARNQHLTNKRGERKINNAALVALALLIAESDPKQKDLIIKLVMNFLHA